ncbi:MAG: NADH-quinone oxidoreductase subunit M [Fimbriimonadaceae bacterium]|nr:NADH-quinone oxidoreductase subunit M [Fimbriimonadaceae bacterium]
MEPTGFGIISIVTFLPLLGALLLGFLPKEQLKGIRYVALGASILTFILSLLMYAKFTGGTYHFQMVEFMPWIEKAGIHYRMGVDGISIWLIMLSTFLSIIAIWFSFYVDKRVKEYMIILLVLETAMLGVFVSLDLILFYVFFEASLIPMWLLISIWGGEKRIYAGLKFFLFTFAGSIFMLIGMITMAWLQQKTTGTWSFNIIDIQSNVANGSLWTGALQLQSWIFWAFAIAFLVKCPAFPLHTWLPDAHTEAPTAGSVILAGVLLKMGTYGMLRFVLPFFPDVIQTYVPWLMALAVIGIIYGAVVAAVQPDVKRLVAYSSVAHMGFVLLGIFSLTHSGMMGGAMQQLNHGISTGALFLLVGLIYERRHTRLFKDYGGLKAQMPIYAAIFLIVMLSSVGLPGMNGFVGEFLAMVGAFEAGVNNLFGLNIWYVVIAGAGVILAAVYLLVMYQKMFYGPNNNPENKRLKDLKPWEIAMCATLILFIFWGGLKPNTFLKPMEASIGAARMMAINPEGQRPTWNDLTMEIDSKGNLARVEERTAADIELKEPTFREIIAPGNIHHPFNPTKPEADDVAALTTAVGEGH